MKGDLKNSLKRYVIALVFALFATSSDTAVAMQEHKLNTLPVEIAEIIVYFACYDAGYHNLNTLIIISENFYYAIKKICSRLKPITPIKTNDSDPDRQEICDMTNEIEHNVELRLLLESQTFPPRRSVLCLIFKAAEKEKLDQSKCATLQNTLETCKFTRDNALSTLICNQLENLLHQKTSEFIKLVNEEAPFLQINSIPIERPEEQYYTVRKIISSKAAEKPILLNYVFKNLFRYLCLKPSGHFRYPYLRPLSNFYGDSWSIQHLIRTRSKLLNCFLTSSKKKEIYRLLGDKLTFVSEDKLINPKTIDLLLPIYKHNFYAMTKICIAAIRNNSIEILKRIVPLYKKTKQPRPPDLRRHTSCHNNLWWDQRRRLKNPILYWATVYATKENMEILEYILQNLPITRYSMINICITAIKNGSIEILKRIIPLYKKNKQPSLFDPRHHTYGNPQWHNRRRLKNPILYWATLSANEENMEILEYILQNLPITRDDIINTLKELEDAHHVSQKVKLFLRAALAKNVPHDVLVRKIQDQPDDQEP